MSLDTKIRAKVAEAVTKSYYKHWHKRWWGRFLLIILFLLVLLLGYFSYLVFNHARHSLKGDIYNEATGGWITLEDYKQARRTISEIISEDEPWLGSNEPAVYITAYESFGCPFCKDNQKDIRELLAKYSSLVRFIVKDFPLEGIQSGVMAAHLAAACANEQGRYWEFSDYLYEHQTDFKEAELKQWAKNLGLDETKFNKCFADDKYSNEIRQDYAEGVKAGVVGTPSYIINSTLISGTIPFATWEQILAYILNNQ
jgi:protein-disulfide isomerase